MQELKLLAANYPIKHDFEIEQCNGMCPASEINVRSSRDGATLMNKFE